MIIRELKEATDLEGLRECIVEIQNHERKLVPSMPSGEAILEDYLQAIIEKCKQYSGSVLVADVGGEIAGFTTIYTRMVSDEVDDGDAEYGYIGDLVVLKRYRQKGYAKQLLADAELLARDHGVETLRIGVLSANSVAADFYLASGFQPFAMQLEKAL